MTIKTRAPKIASVVAEPALKPLVDMNLNQYTFRIELTSDDRYLFSKFDNSRRDELTGLSLCECDAFFDTYDEAWNMLKEFINHQMIGLYIKGNPKLNQL